MKHKKLLILTIIMGTFVQELAYSEVFSKKDSYYFPYISGSLLVEEKYDRLLDGNNGFLRDKKDLLFTYVNTNININFTNYFSLGSRFILRPTEKRNNSHIYNDFYGNEIPIKRDFYFFKSYGFLLEELYLEYKEELFRAGFGKFNPGFGYAYSNDRYYGILGQNIVDQYKLSEVLGAFVVMQLPMLNMRLDMFNKDTTFMSGSLLGNRNTYNAEHNPGNSGNMLNFSLSGDFLLKENIKMNFGYRNLGVKKDEFKKRESSFLAGLEYIVEEGQFNLGYAASTEVVYVNNYNGDMGRHVLFATANLPFFYGGWNFGLNYSLKMDFEEKFDSAYSQIFGAGIGYTFKNGIMIDFARKFERETYKLGRNYGKKEFCLSSWGARISYNLKF